MATHIDEKPKFIALVVRVALIVGIASGFAGLTGCGHDETNVPKAEVKTVEAYGVTLGPDASPQQVVYVLLKSVVDDYAATKAKNFEAEKKAQYLTYSLAAPDVIEDRLVAAANQQNPNLHKTELGPDRDAKIFKTVHFWAPIVGHYVPSFANADLQTVVRDSWVTIAPNGKTAHVFYPVSHNPAETDPAKAETATIKVELNREPGEGGAEYWRVSRVQFLGRQFRATAPQIVQAYGVTLDDSATPQQVTAVALRTLGEMAADTGGQAASGTGADTGGQAASGTKAESKDVKASAMYRMFNLSYPAKVSPATQASATGGIDIEDPTTRNLAAAVTQWAQQVQPVAAVLNDSAKVTPERMQLAGAASPDAAQVTYAPEGQASIVVQLARQPAEAKTFWRVVSVTTQGPVGGSPAESRPATQAGGGK